MFDLVVIILQPVVTKSLLISTRVLILGLGRVIKTIVNNDLTAFIMASMVMSGQEPLTSNCPPN